MILDKVTFKQGKTHWRLGLITDPTARVVTDANADVEQNQPFRAESTEMHVSLTSKYRSRVLLAMYAGLHL